MFQSETPVKRSWEGNDKKGKRKKKANIAGVEWINGIITENSRFCISSFDSFGKL